MDDVAQLPIKPVYNESLSLDVSATIAAGVIAETREVGPSEGTMKYQIIFHACIYYHELNGKKRETGIALAVSPNIPAYNIHPNDVYNYYT